MNSLFNDLEMQFYYIVLITLFQHFNDPISRKKRRLFSKWIVIKKVPITVVNHAMGTKGSKSKPCFSSTKISQEVTVALRIFYRCLVDSRSSSRSKNFAYEFFLFNLFLNTHTFSYLSSVEIMTLLEKSPEFFMKT